jgi:hypothetical protein
MQMAVVQSSAETCFFFFFFSWRNHVNVIGTFFFGKYFEQQRAFTEYQELERKIRKLNREIAMRTAHNIA